MRRRSLPYVALLAMYLMTPLSAEVTENVVHLLAEGHLAHALPDAEHQAQGPEHGCSGSFHVCSCHVAPSFLGSQQTCRVPAGVRRAPAPPVADSVPEGHGHGVFRPPIA